MLNKVNKEKLLEKPENWSNKEKVFGLVP